MGSPSVNRQLFTADLAAYDGAGRTVLVVDVKMIAATDLGRQLAFLSAHSGNADYLMVVDPTTIRVYRQIAGAAAPELLAELPSKAVLSEYEPEYGSVTIFEPYMIALVETWLTDLATHWKSETPPGYAQLAGSGLIERIAGGTTEREAIVDGDPVR